MSVVRAKSQPYGPVTIDVQLEQGADFLLPVEIQVNAVPVDLSSATIEAWMSNELAPTVQSQIALTITAVDLVNGMFNVSFPAIDSLALVLPAPTQDSGEPLTTILGNWILHITDTGSTVRYVEGLAYLDRAPWLT